ncbi:MULTISPECIES: class Ib ribonucleoside-diphosphate reductase assembly flavoprotein NrdI [Helcococcus]|uniref:Class Ib ribonucleoside-diphosphate reductase assembly flavoprotein NrdI n=1 Tax=Helcococcus bovis TaxID=3153252 RepID=A0ABW9F620_9FIRM
MYIIVDSITGNSIKFAIKTGYTYMKVKDRKNIKEGDKFLLITRCQNFGEIPMNTQLLLYKYHSQCIGVVVSGNRNWGKHFGVSGDLIEKQYNIKCILKFEGTGYPHEVEIVKKFIEQYEREHND